VITVSNTAAPTVVAIDSTGADAVFVDIDLNTHLMDTTYPTYGMAEQYYIVQTPVPQQPPGQAAGGDPAQELHRLDDYIAGRRAVAARYAEALVGTNLILQSGAAGNDHVYDVYVVRPP
jgi:dTDP-4-amino-4,6-dideoxygalactose transaminase